MYLPRSTMQLLSESRKRFVEPEFHRTQTCLTSVLTRSGESSVTQTTLVWKQTSAVGGKAGVKTHSLQNRCTARGLSDPYEECLVSNTLWGGEKHSHTLLCLKEKTLHLYIKENKLIHTSTQSHTWNTRIHIDTNTYTHAQTCKKKCTHIHTHIRHNTNTRTHKRTDTSELLYTYSNPSRNLQDHVCPSVSCKADLVQGGYVLLFRSWQG